jgi:hypothetical protein
MNKNFYLATISFILLFVSSLFIMVFNKGFVYSSFSDLVAIDSKDLDYNLNYNPSLSNSSFKVVHKGDFEKIKNSFDGTVYTYITPDIVFQILNLIYLSVLALLVNVTFLFFYKFKKHTSVKSFFVFFAITKANLAYYLVLILGVLSFMSRFIWIDKISITLVLLFILINFIFSFINVNEVKEFDRYTNLRKFFKTNLQFYVNLLLPMVLFSGALIFLTKNWQFSVILLSSIIIQVVFYFYFSLVVTYKIFVEKKEIDYRKDSINSVKKTKRKVRHNITKKKKAKRKKRK